MMASFLALLLALSALTSVNGKAPNIVFVLLDDVGYTDMFNNDTKAVVPMPFMNSLVSQGVHFTNHYVAPTCTPSRASLLTGRYPANTGLTWPLFPASPTGLRADQPTLPEVLRDHAGYRTAMSGKWHLGNAQWRQTPVGRGFDVHVGCYMWDIDYSSKQFHYAPWEPLATDWIRAHRNGSYEHYNEPGHATDAITAAAEQMMRDHAAATATATATNDASPDPLFLYVAYTAAHSPLQPAPEDEAACKHITHQWRRQFCGLLVGVDRNLRRLHASVLHSLGPDTVLVLASDNGGSPWFGGMNAPYRGGKTTPMQGGVLVPALAVDLSADQRYFGSGGGGGGGGEGEGGVAGQGGGRGRRFNHLMHVSDWFPTLLSLALEGRGSGVEEGSEVSSLLADIDGIDMTRAIRLSADPHHAHTSSGASSSPSTSPTPAAPRSEVLLEMYYPGESCFEDASMEAYLYGDLKLIHGELTESLWIDESSVLSNEETSTIFSDRFLKFRFPGTVQHASACTDTNCDNAAAGGVVTSMLQQAVETYVWCVLRYLEISINLVELAFGAGAFDSTRIFLIHAFVLPHVESVLRRVPGSLRSPSLDEARAAQTPAVAGLSSSSKPYYLFNLTADPYELHNLDVADYPEQMAHIRSQLDKIRAARPPQQRFWMQLHNLQSWPATFAGPGKGIHRVMAGAGAGAGTGTSAALDEFSDEYTGESENERLVAQRKQHCPQDTADCRFVHPWYADDMEDPWSDPRLVDGKVVGTQKFHTLMRNISAGLLCFLGTAVVLYGNWVQKSEEAEKEKAAKAKKKA